MCKSDTDYNASFGGSLWDGKTCAFWDGLFMSMFDGEKLNWAEVTPKELGCTKYDHSRLDLRGSFAADVNMADVLASFAAVGCCRGKSAKEGNCPPGPTQAAAPADSKFFLTLTVTMPYSRAEFTTDKQNKYKSALATVAGVPETNVEIVKIVEKGRRAGGVDVESKVLLQPETCPLPK